MDNAGFPAVVTAHFVPIEGQQRPRTTILIKFAEEVKDCVVLLNFCCTLTKNISYCVTEKDRRGDFLSLGKNLLLEDLVILYLGKLFVFVQAAKQ